MRFSSLLMAMVLVGGCSGTPASEAQTPPPPARRPARRTVLATVNGAPITEDDVRKAAGLEIARLEEQLYQLRKQQVDALVAQRLLEAEAARRGLSVAALEQAEIIGKAGAVTEPEIDAFVAGQPGSHPRRRRAAAPADSRVPAAAEGRRAPHGARGRPARVGEGRHAARRRPCRSAPRSTSPARRSAAPPRHRSPSSSTPTSIARSVGGCSRR